MFTSSFPHSTHTLARVLNSHLLSIQGSRRHFLIVPIHSYTQQLSCTQRSSLLFLKVTIRLQRFFLILMHSALTSCSFHGSHTLATVLLNSLTSSFSSRCLAGYSSAAGAETTVCEACKVFYQTSLSRGSTAECRCHNRSSSSLHAGVGGGESRPVMIQPGEVLLDCDACRLVVCQRVFRSVFSVEWVNDASRRHWYIRLFYFIVYHFVCIYTTLSIAIY